MQEPLLQDDSIAQLPHNSLSRESDRCDRLQFSFVPIRQDKAELSNSSPTEMRRDRLLETTATVAHLLLTAENLDDSIKQVLQLLGETLDSDRVNVIENFTPASDAPSLHWRVLYEWDSPGTPSQFSDPTAAQGSYAEIPAIFEQLQQGHTVTYLIQDVPEPFRSSQTAIGVKATYLTPIQVEGQWWGIIGLDDCQAVRHRDPAELTVLGVLANCLGSAIQRERTQQALLQAELTRSQELERLNLELQQALSRLSESEERYRNLFELSSEGFYYTEINPPVAVDLPIEEQCDLLYQNIRVVKANPAFAAMYGVDNPAKLVGLRNADVHVENSSKNAAFIRGIVENGYQIRNAETEEVDFNGNPRYFLNNAIVIVKDGYAVSGWASQLDITQLRLVQQALLKAEQERAAELARSNEALQQTIDTLGALDNFDDFIPTVLTIVARTFNANNCAYYEHKRDETVYLRYWFSHGKILNPLDLQLLDSEQHRVLRQLADGFTVPLEHLHGTTVRDRTRSVIIDHTRAKAAPAFHTFAVSQGWGLELNQPLLVDGKADGALVIYRGLDQPFSDLEIMLAEGLAKQLALAMQANRLSAQARDRAVETAIAREQEKAAQQQAAELSRANTLLRNSLSRLSTEPNLDDVLGQLLLEVTRYAGASVGHVFSYDAIQDTLTMKLRVRDEQIFWTPADDEPAIFRSPIPVATTPVFTNLCQHPHLATLNISQFSGRLWAGIPEWFEAKSIRGTSSCVLLVGDRPFGFLAMGFPHPVALRLVDEELILALAQQIALVMQLTTLAEAAKETALLEERNRFARDIHDTIAQALTGIILQLEATKGIIATQPEVAHEHLARARALARDGLAEARRSVWALRPEALESHDLPTVLHHLAQRMTTGTPLDAVVEVIGTPFPLSPTLEMNLLRIGQEALTNVLRHAQATAVRLALHFTPQAVRLEVVDDGQGFDPQHPIVDRGFGLIGMQERSQRLGGRFNLTSYPELGTTISVTVPTSGG